ncbi:hypothetical protein ACFWD7_50785 [Streptomyces mirabilis]|uniref:hypothetical protein n=1 Tax=Streptomyces mirabilis TaxID=68239 RepID=UPI0021BF605F|nr:hypothetical protein [Streptomyces mirabilis]MCT9114199.1 hypothetical protein [Streptomyces mirabilis]
MLVQQATASLAQIDQIDQRIVVEERCRGEARRPRRPSGCWNAASAKGARQPLFTEGCH